MTMRLTVLQQQAKGLKAERPQLAQNIEQLESFPADKLGNFETYIRKTIEFIPDYRVCRIDN